MLQELINVTKENLAYKELKSIYKDYCHQFNIEI